MTTLTINGTAADDTIVVTATGADSGSYSINGGPAVAFSGVTQLAVTGGAGNDTLTIVNPTGGLFAPVNGISYDGGGQPADTLEILGGVATQLTYTAGATHDAGTLMHTGAAGTQTIDFAGIAPITDTVAAATLVIKGTAGDGIFAGILSIGDSAAGRISFVSGIAPAGVNQLELVTGADIQDNHVGTDMTVARLAMSAGTGIGAAGTSAGIDTDVSLIEAETITGGLNISNVGAVTVGGVTGVLIGLSVDASGDLNFTAGGTIELADLDGSETVHGGASSGNVFLTASGSGADVTSTVDRDAITAQAGNITVTAARDILFGTAVTDQDGDVLANGSITLSAGRDIVLDGNADVASDNFGGDTGGGVTATAGRNISIIGGSSASIGGGGNAGADVTLTTGVDGLLTVNAQSPSADVFSDSGDVTINADRMAIGVIPSIVGGQSVTLQPVSSAWAVNLGSLTDVAAGTLELSDAELDGIVTPTLRIGSTAMTGDLTVSSQITAEDYDTLSLRTGGGIVDGIAAPVTDITVDNLALHSATGIGRSSAVFQVAVSNLAFENSGTGVVDIENASGLTLAAVDGLSASSNAGGSAQVFTNGAMTIATNVTTSDVLILGASETAAAGDNLTILAGTTVRSTGSSIQMGAGDNLTAQAGSTIQSNLLLLTFVDAGNADAGVGGIANLNGAVVVPSVTEIIGSVDNDTLNGTPLADVLVGDEGTDVMRGGLGDDDYWVDNGGDAVIEIAGQGVDRVLAVTHFTLSDNVENLELLGADNLQGYGNGLANLITGNEGSNLLDGRAGADSMKGGLGNDVYMVDNAGDSVIENAGEGNDAVFSTAHFALSANVEALVLQGTADLQGYGNDLANTIYGNTGNNLLDGRSGADVMTGGAGNDTYFLDNALDAVIENAGEGNDAEFASINAMLAANVETLVLPGSADLQGYGNALINTLYGNTGNNLLNGGAGADLMVGGAGNDAYFVDDTSDAAFESPGEGNDTVFSTANYRLAADVETLVLQGNADLQGYGNGSANTLFGNTGGNLLNGAGGADVMVGGAGNDTYFVDDGFDRVIENAAAGNDAIFSSVHYILPTNVETLVLQGSAAANGTGNALANAIFGNSGDNLLDGQGGADVLTGGAGNDTFVFVVGQGNGDTVVDFAGNGAAAGDSLKFVGYGAGASFTNVDATHWQVNYNGGTAHDLITFMNGAAIDQTDFLLV
jgi:trimeric autotransporter adhesin